MKKQLTWQGFLALILFSFTGFSVFAQPANDNLCSATPLTLGAGCSGTSNGDNTGATLQTGEALGSCFGGTGTVATVWYSFVAPASGFVDITTNDANGGFAGTNDDTNIALYSLPSGSTCATPSALVELDCNEDISFFNFLSTITNAAVTPGQTYYVQVAGYSTTVGTFCIRVDSVAAPVPPVNDSICNAIPLIVGAGCSGGPNGDNTNGTLQTGEDVGSCYGGGETTTVWYTFVAPASGLVTVTTEPGFAGTNTDTEISLWTLAPFATCQNADSLTQVDCNDDTPTTPGNLSTMDSVVVIPGNTYYVQVTGFSDLQGTFCVRVEDYSPPVAPANDSLCNATMLTVNAGCSASNGDNTNATLESGEEVGSCYLNSTTVTVWYAFVAPPSGVVGITTDGGFSGTNDDTQISLWSLPSSATCTDIDSLVEIACNEDISTSNFLSSIQSVVITPGSTYYIQVSGYANTEGTFCIQVDSLSSVLNDDVCAAIALPVDGAARTYSNVGATLQTGEAALEQPQSSGSSDPSGWNEPTISNSVWFTFVAPASGVVEVDLCGPGNTNFDTQVALYQATNCADFSTFTFVAANDDLENQCSTFPSGTTGNWASTLTNCVVPGETYYVLVDGFRTGTAASEQGTFGISLTEIVGATTPLDVTATAISPLCPTDANGSATISFDGGFAPYSVLWNTGATTSGLINLSIGTYTYSVTDGCDSTVTGSVVLAANPLAVQMVVDTPACAGVPIQLGTDITGGKKILSKSLFGVDLGTGRVMKMALNEPGATTPVSATPITGAFYGADFAFNVLFAINNTNNAFVAIDPNSGVSSTAGTSVKLAGHTWTGLAFDNASSTLFGLSTDGTTTQLYTVNFSNGTATPLIAVTAPSTFVPIWLAIDNNSQMYALNIVDDNLYKINPSTGTATVVGNIGFSTGFAQDADFDPSTNVLYAGIYDTDNEETQLRSINTTTGASTFIGVMGNGVSEMDAIAIQAETLPPYAYSWTPSGGLSNTGIANPVATISASTEYIVSVVDACGSIASDTATVSVVAPMILRLSTIAPTAAGNDGSATASVFSGGRAPFTYLWSNGVTTATNSGLSAIQYTVTVTDAAGCSVTDSVNVAITSLDDLRNTGISSVRLYPNPSEGRFNLEVALDRSEDLTIRIFDTNGRLVAERRAGYTSTFNQEIDLGNVASGMYQLTLSTSRGAASVRFFVR